MRKILIILSIFIANIFIVFGNINDTIQNQLNDSFTKTCDKINIKTQKILLNTSSDSAKYHALLNNCNNINNTPNGELSKTSLQFLLKNINKNWAVASDIEEKKKDIRKKINSSNYSKQLDEFAEHCDSIFEEHRRDKNLERLKEIVKQYINAEKRRFNKLEAEKLSVKEESTFPSQPDIEESSNISEKDNENISVLNTNLGYIPDSIETSTPDQTKIANNEKTEENQTNIIASNKEGKNGETQLQKLFSKISDKYEGIIFISFLTILLIVLLYTKHRQLKTIKIIFNDILPEIIGIVISDNRSKDQNKELKEYFSSHLYKKFIIKNTVQNHIQFIKIKKAFPKQIINSILDHIRDNIEKFDKNENARTQDIRLTSSKIFSFEEIKMKLDNYVGELIKKDGNIKYQRVFKYEKAEIENLIYNFSNSIIENEISENEVKAKIENVFVSKTREFDTIVFKEELENELTDILNKIILKYNQKYNSILESDAINEIINDIIDVDKIFSEVIGKSIRKEELIQIINKKELIIKSAIEFKVANLNTYYLPFPGPGFFWDSKKSKDFNDESAFILRVSQRNKETGEFEFVEKQERRNNAVKSYRRFLQPVCQFTNSPINAKDFKMLDKGTAMKDGDKWIVKEEGKMKIEFTY